VHPDALVDDDVGGLGGKSDKASSESLKQTRGVELTPGGRHRLHPRLSMRTTMRVATIRARDVNDVGKFEVDTTSETGRDST